VSHQGCVLFTGLATCVGGGTHETLEGGHSESPGLCTVHRFSDLCGGKSILSGACTATTTWKKKFTCVWKTRLYALVRVLLLLLQ